MFKYQIDSLDQINLYYVEDKSKIITEPSVYTKGEDIKIKDFFDTTTTFGFYKNTQILQAIIITGISEIDYLEHLRKMIFQQLGEPYQGYEIKITNNVKSKIISNYVTFDNRYKYKIGDKCLDSG